MPTLNWIGKDAVVEHHKEVPYHLLRCDPELSVGDPGSGNLLIHGDNLLALKALLPYYAGKVKCIYIDPPYNTGNESWVYNDNVTSPEIQAWLGQVVGKDLADLSRHDKWLCMMYPRLYLLRSLLRDDGFICVQIDDSESANLRHLLDEIFSPSNYLGTLYIKVRYEGKTLKQDMDIHKQIEQIFIYRSGSSAEPILLERSYSFEKFCWYVREKNPGRKIRLGGKDVEIFSQEEYEIYEGDPSEAGLKEIWASGAILDGNSSGRFFRDYLTGRSIEDGLGVMYKVYGIGDDMYDYRYFTGPKRRGAIRGKYYQGVPIDKLNTNVVRSNLPISNFFDMAADFGNIRHEGGVEFKSGKKPESLLTLLLTHLSLDGDLVLDSFAGSGTTAAVSHKMKRKWITIEMGEHCFSHTLPRLTNVIDGDKTGVSSDYAWKGGGGFSFCTLDEPLFGADGQIRPEVTFGELARHVFFTETGEPLPASPSPVAGEGRGGGSPLLGVANDHAVYLLFNGILGDKSTTGGNVLTRQILANLPPHEGPKTIYGEGCLLSPATLQAMEITFRQLPYQVKIT